MQIVIKKQIGRTVYSFMVDGKNLHELIMQSQKLSFSDVYKCGKCGKDNLRLAARKAQGFDYTEIRCNDCKASLTFGSKKEDKDISYLRKNDDGSFDWKSVDEQSISE